jgi:hypothetical protein
MKRIMNNLKIIQNYNFEHECSYMNYKTDDDTLYQKDFLNSFKIEDGIFDLNRINRTVSSLFEAIKEDDNIIKLLNTIKNKYNVSDLELAFMMCFSYDFFDRTHKILCNYRNGLNSNDLIDNVIKQCNQTM